MIAENLKNLSINFGQEGRIRSERQMGHLVIRDPRILAVRKTDNHATIPATPRANASMYRIRILALLRIQNTMRGTKALVKGAAPALLARFHRKFQAILSSRQFPHRQPGRIQIRRRQAHFPNTPRAKVA